MFKSLKVVGFLVGFLTRMELFAVPTAIFSLQLKNAVTAYLYTYIYFVLK